MLQSKQGGLITATGGGYKHLPEFDALKGFAMLFIILIHSLCEHPVDLRGNLPLLWRMSGSFALCAFFMISGFLYHHDQTPLKIFFKKKISRLLYPYILFASASILLRFAFSTITYNPDNGNLLLGGWKILTGQIFWFLYSMFLVLFVNRLFHRFRWWIAVACLIVTIWGIPEISEFTLSNSIYYNVWFCMGIWINRHYAAIKKFALKHYWALLFVALLGYAGSLMWSNRHISAIVLPLFGCIAAWSICLKLSENKVLLHLGKYSMQYYTIHLLICFVFYFIGAWVYNQTSSYVLALVSIYLPLVFTTYLGLLIEKKIKFMYPLFGL